MTFDELKEKYGAPVFFVEQKEVVTIKLSSGSEMIDVDAPLFIAIFKVRKNRDYGQYQCFARYNRHQDKWKPGGDSYMYSHLLKLMP